MTTYTDITEQPDSEIEDDLSFIARRTFLYEKGRLHFLYITDTSAKVEIPFFRGNVIREILHSIKTSSSTHKDLLTYITDNYQDLISELSNESSWTERTKKLYTMWELICKSEFSETLKNILGNTVPIFSYLPLYQENLDFLIYEDLSGFFFNLNNNKLWEVKPENRLEYFAEAVIGMDTSGFNLQSVVMLDGLIKECYDISEKWRSLYD